MTAVPNLASNGPAAPEEPAARSAYVLEEQVGFLLRLATQRHTAIFAARMIEGLTPPQFAALAKLAEIGPCSQNRLGRMVGLDTNTIKGVVDRLAARGFVSALPDAEDRRRRALGLTEAGRSVAAPATAAAVAITAATLAPLGQAERVLFLASLKKLG